MRTVVQFAANHRGAATRVGAFVRVPVDGSVSNRIVVSSRTPRAGALIPAGMVFTRQAWFAAGTTQPWKRTINSTARMPSFTSDRSLDVRRQRLMTANRVHGRDHREWKRQDHTVRHDDRRMRAS